jgi:hypothetical protein
MEACSAMANSAVDTYLPLTVAGNAIAHCQIHGLIHAVHSLNGAMTGLTKNFGTNVRPVLKVNKIRHRGNLVPPDGLFLVPIVFQFLNLWVACRSYFMAAHATLNGRNARYGSPLGIDVAISAGDLILARMDFVIEGNWLCGRWCFTRNRHFNSDG